MQFQLGKTAESEFIFFYYLCKKISIMTTTALCTKISTLPPSIQKEIVDFMEFLIQKHQTQKNKIHPKAGCMKGTFQMSPDFNEPLEDFKEYMQ